MLEFVYLTVVLDARRVIGWSLNCTLEDDLATVVPRLGVERCWGAGLVNRSVCLQETNCGMLIGRERQADSA